MNLTLKHHNSETKNQPYNYNNMKEHEFNEDLS